MLKGYATLYLEKAAQVTGAIEALDNLQFQNSVLRASNKLTNIH